MCSINKTKENQKKRQESTSDVQGSVIHVLVGQLRVRTWFKCFHMEWKYQEKSNPALEGLTWFKEVLETDSSYVSGYLYTSSPIHKLFKNMCSRLSHKAIYIASLPSVFHERMKYIL